MSLLNEINEIDFSKHTEYFRTQKIFNTGKSRQLASFFKVGGVGWEQIHLKNS